MRHRERGGRHHIRVCEERLLDLARRDLLAAPVDDLLGPAGEREVSVVVEMAEVSGAEPPVGRERREVDLRIGEVRARDVRSAHHDLAHRTGREDLVVGTEHRDLAPGRAVRPFRAAATPGGSGLVAI